MTMHFPDWPNFQEAREAIALMPLKELAGLSGQGAPPLLPHSGWAVLVGMLVFLLAVMFDLNALRFPGLAVVFYGLVALSINRARASAYRERIYRAYVQNMALDMQESSQN